MAMNNNIEARNRVGASAEPKEKDALANAEYLFNAGHKTWRNADYARAIELWDACDKAGFSYGYVKAHFQLGRIHYFGLHVPENRAKGLEYLVEVAEKGFEEAKDLLRDIGEADAGSDDFFEKGEVYLTLATAYSRGLGVPRNAAKARAHYDKFMAKWTLYSKQNSPNQPRSAAGAIGAARAEPPQP